MEEIKRKLLEILEDMHPGSDMESCRNLVSGGMLDSFDVVSLIAEMNDEFEVSVSADKIVPENFDSVDAMCRMVLELMDEET
ncbi:MAG: acyl carrier protein [Lachnospiraceae bacterium]|nr:acyl carrier protein [Lachnospiraceae bacterium]